MHFYFLSLRKQTTSKSGATKCITLKMRCKIYQQSIHRMSIFLKANWQMSNQLKDQFTLIWHWMTVFQWPGRLQISVITCILLILRSFGWILAEFQPSEHTYLLNILIPEQGSMRRQLQKVFYEPRMEDSKWLSGTYDWKPWIKMRICRIYAPLKMFEI